SRLLEIVLAAAVAVGRAVVVPTVRLQLVDHLVEVVADVLAELLAHLPHPAGHALRVVLVHAAGRGVGEIVEAALVRAEHREAGHEAREIPAAAPVALGRDRLARPEREHRHLPPAARAAVLVDRHGGGIIAWRRRGAHGPGRGATWLPSPRSRGLRR